MRFGTRRDGAPCLITDDDRVVPLDGAAGFRCDALEDVIEAFPEAQAALTRLSEQSADDRRRVSDDGWTAPLPRPRRNIFCVGKNYVDHAKEFADSGFDSAAQRDETVPDHPIIFTKAPETVIGPGDAIEIPAALTRQVDYEAEIAVVIGRAGRFIAEDAAMDHVFGFTLLNDVTARDLQKRHKQWFLGKSIETFCPMGPFLVTADQVDLKTLRLRCDVNGEERQNAAARDMIFSVPQIIAVLSRSMTLRPGDVIATGTPAGVGAGLSPPAFLKDGDAVTVSASGLGALSNPVRAV